MLSAALLLTALMACEFSQDEVTASATTESCVVTDDGSGVQTQTLYAGQTIDAGTVSVAVLGDSLTVTYETTDGWELDEVHVWVGTDLADMPQGRSGNPQIGLFPYTTESPDSPTSHTFVIPLDELGFSCPGDDDTYLVAAHAALSRDDGEGGVDTETGWADGDRIVDRGSWATYFGFDLSCECDGGEEEEEGECETAYAYDEDGTCFLDIDIDGDGEGDFSRWGWSIPVSEGTSESFDLYAAAGQCDLDKGTLVGSVTVSYADGSGTVTYTTADGYTLEETHLYIGEALLPVDVNGNFTLAPGQYPYTSDLDGVGEDSHDVEGVSGDLNLVAHAVVCGL